MEKRTEEMLPAPPEVQEFGAYIRPGRRDRLYKWLGGGMAAYFAALGLLVSNSEKQVAEPPGVLAQPAALDYGMEGRSNSPLIPRNQRRILSRSTVDRPDTVTGPQVHPIYVLSSDAPDLRSDTNGTLEELISDSQSSLAPMAEGLSLRYDTYKDPVDNLEHVDISFFRSSKSADELEKYGHTIVGRLNDELWNAGFSRSPDKVLLLLYGGGRMKYDIGATSSAEICGVASWPPKVPGNVAVVSLSQSGCNSSARIFNIPHEIFHATGQVPESAPNYDGWAHTTDKHDLMGNSTTSQVSVDPGHDDYWAYIQPRMEIGSSQLRMKIRGPGTAKVVGKNACKNVCNYSLRSGKDAELLAKPAKNSRFVRWLGACGTSPSCEVAINHNISSEVTAVFAKKPRARPRK